MLHLCLFIQIVLFTNLSWLFSLEFVGSTISTSHSLPSCVGPTGNLCSYMQDFPSTHRFAPTYPQSYVSCSYIGMGRSMMGFVSGGPFWNGAIYRSVERRVGKERRSRWSPY